MRRFLKVEILAIEICVLDICLLLHVDFLVGAILLVQLPQYLVHEFFGLEPGILIVLVSPEENFTRIVFLDKPWFVLMIVIKRVFLLLFVLVHIVLVSVVQLIAVESPVLILLEFPSRDQRLVEVRKVNLLAVVPS